MNRSASSQLRIAVAVLCAAAAACSSGDGSNGSDDDDGAGSVADAGLDAGLECESTGGAGESFEMLLGARTGNEYVELSDGDSITVVLGFQGLYMLLLASEAALPVSSESLCLYCVVDVSPSTSGDFDGTSQNGNVGFATVDGDTFRGAFTIIVGSQSEKPQLTDAEVELSMSCSGHGYAGSVERSLRLMPE